ncbi:hypothetical protein Lal_00048514 [Lupinus albus]|nr:hypothetical protein Lal_00048514 [Lupinus albus]
MRKQLHFDDPSDAVSNTKNMPKHPLFPPKDLHSRSLSHGIGTRRVMPTTLPIVSDGDTTVDKLLPNGDFYVGSFSGDVNGNMEKLPAKENSRGLRVRPMKENSSLVEWKDSEPSSVTMEKRITERGAATKNTGLG